MAELFETWRIGSMELRNRIVRSATAESLCTKEGAPSKRMVDVYQLLGEGGAGAIVTGYAYVNSDGKPSERSMNLGEDLDPAQFRELVDTVHGEGGRIIAQLVYGGSKSKLDPDDPRRISHAADGRPDAGDADVADGRPNAVILGPSALAHPTTGIVPTPASEADLSRVVRDFAAAAARAKRYGFDGVEVHAAHGYLLSQFLDGRFNKRDDSYGGSLENRARLALACVRAVRKEVGPDFCVLVKLNSCDALGDATGETGGMSESESMQVAAWLAEAGASCIDVSGDWHGVERDDITGEPFFGSYATRLSAKLDVPVILTGGWRDIEVIERYLATTKVAGFGMARPLICETYLPARWKDGDRRASKCTSCDFCARYMGIPCIENRLSR